MDALLFTKFRHLIEVLHRLVTEGRVGQRSSRRHFACGHDLGPQIVTIKGHQVLFEPVLEIFRRQFVPAAVVAEDREDVIDHALAFAHRGFDRIPLRRTPAHAVQRHAVIGLFLWLVIHQGQNIEDNDVRGFIAERILKKVVGLPDQLLGAATDKTVYSELFPELYGREVLIDLAVTDKKHIVIAVGLVVLSRECSLGNIAHILWAQKKVHAIDQESRNNNKRKHDGHAHDHLILPALRFGHFFSPFSLTQAL